ncbi:hypothetical protein GGH96_003228 [Coemansia sp. RSA 1972]|nr:hypothetical protein GGH96_003228 [Coemansia sp. RSA 1972]
MPPSELISVRSFRDKFASLVRNQKDCGLFNAQSEWSPEEQEAVANRCQIADDMSFSNAAFVNPTLFHMLRQHREFNEATERELLQQKREYAAEQERRRIERQNELLNGHRDTPNSQQNHVNEATINGNSLDGQYSGTQNAEFVAAVNGAADNHEFADDSMLLAVDDNQGEPELGAQSMDVDVSTVEDALARLASGNDDMNHMLSEENNQAGEAENNATEDQEVKYDLVSESQKDPESTEVSHEAETEAGIDADNTMEIGDAAETDNNMVAEASVNGVADEMQEEDDEDDIDDLIGDESGSDYDEDSIDLEDNDDEVASPVCRTPIRNGPIKSFEDVTLITPHTDLPKGITADMLKKAIANSGYVRSTDVDEPTRRVVRPRVRVEEPAGVSELETKFRSVKDLLDESTLASLRKANRRMIPPKYRLEVNFMTNRVQPGPVPNATPVADDEVILSVCFYNTRSSTSKMEEYLVLGSQSLTVLRDAFYCISDFLVSDHDDKTENTKDRKVSSSYFFIEKTFYNDMRSPTATDYSRVITEWANDPARQEKNPRLRGLQSRLMDGARFLDLSIKLRQPYIFMHQGDCEHVMMFTDLRLLGTKDDQHVEAYPKQIFRTRHMRHKCRMCSAYPAQYVTKNDFHSGMSPCYFCEKCYTPFHYDNGGSKLLDHDVFPYANVNLM